MKIIKSKKDKKLMSKNLKIDNNVIFIELKY